MPSHAFYAKGEWNFVCDQCGLVYKASRARFRWDGAIVCDAPGCWEIQHPQMFLVAVPDNQATPWARVWTPPSSLTITVGFAIGDVAFGDVALGGL